MQYIGEWSTADRKKLVVFTPDVLAVFWKYRQLFFWQPESGGILLGRRRGKHLEVLMATEPSSYDKRSTYSFLREAAGHADVAQRAWLMGEHKIDYVGEWHTHPQGVPIPSGIDRAEWCKLAMQCPDKTTLLTVIVGTLELRVELVDHVRHEVLGSIPPVQAQQ